MYLYPTFPSRFENKISFVLRVFIPTEFYYELPVVDGSSTPFRLSSTLFSIDSKGNRTVYAYKIDEMKIEHLSTQTQVVRSVSPVAVTVTMYPTLHPLPMDITVLAHLLYVTNSTLQLCSASAQAKLAGNSLEILWMHPKVTLYSKIYLLLLICIHTPGSHHRHTHIVGIC